MEVNEKLQKLKEQERFLMAQLAEKYRILEESKKNLCMVQDKEAHFLQEIENIKTLNETKEAKLKSKLIQLQTNLKIKQDHALTVKEQRDKTVSKTQEDIQALHQKLNNKSLKQKEKEEVNVHKDEFLQEIAVFKEEVLSKQSIVEDLQNLVEQLNYCITTKEANLEKTNENIKFSRKEVAEAYDLFNNTEENLLMLKNELHSFQNKPMPGKVGNSLFDEVNEPRVDLQLDFANLKKKCKEIDSEISIVHNRIVLLRQQRIEIEDFIKTHPNKVAHNYNFLITMYNETISRMKKVSTEYQKVLDEKYELVNNGIPIDVCVFYSNTIKEKEKTHLRVKEITDRQLLANKLMDIEVRENEKHLRRQEIEEKGLFKKVNDLQETIEKTRHLLNHNKENLPVEQETPHKNSCERVLSATSLITVINDKKNVLVEKKKVQFADDVAQPSKKSGKVLQYKSIHFPSMKKKI